MSEQRDTDLGARLDELDVPEHGPEYWSAVMAAAEPELERLRGATETVYPRRPFAAFVERHPAFSGGFKWWATAAVAVAVALFLLLGGLPGGKHGQPFVGPQPATAAEAIRYALGALDDAQAIEGTMYIGKVRNGVFSAGDKVTFLWARDGSYRVTSRAIGPDTRLGVPGAVSAWAYSVPTRQNEAVFDWGAKGFTSTNSSQDPTTGKTITTESHYRYVWSEQTDVPPAAPDSPEYGAGDFRIWQVRAYLRTMLDDPGVKLQVIEVGGRQAWLLTTSAFGAGSAGHPAKGHRVTIAIDAQTRLPLRFSGFLAEYEVRIDSAVVSRSPAPTKFHLQRPPAAETYSDHWYDVSSRFPSLPFGDKAGMRKAVDDLSAFPSWVPHGFTLQAGASNTSGGVSLPRHAGYSRSFIPNTIVSLRFRRGFDVADVTLRPDPRLSHKSMTGLPGGGEPTIRVDTSNPFVSDVSPWDRAQWRTHTMNVRLGNGFFRGAIAHIVVDPGFWPHLWVKKDAFVATVAGDLTKAQMVRVAESLGPWKAAGGE